MEISLILLGKVIQLFLMMAMAFLLVKIKLLKSSDSKILSVIMVYLLTPCMILNSFQIEATKQVKTGLVFALLISVLVHVLFLVITYLIKNILKLDIIEQANIVYTNAGILVIPIIEAILGKEYVIYSCAFMMVQLFLLWTHCSSMLCGMKSIQIKKIICNINIIAILIGGIMFLFNLSFPKVLGETISTVGGMMGPVGMMLAGMVIAEDSLIDQFKNIRLYLPMLLRLIILPVIVLTLFAIIPFSSFVTDGKNILMIVYLASITPACATVTSMAQLYDKNAKHSSQLFMITTLCSIVTMPVMIGLYDYFIH